MKYAIILIILNFTFSAFAKEVRDFNKVLIQNVQKDIRNNNDEQFKAKPVSRGPASVEANENTIQEDKKIDKMNIRQIGPNKW